MRKTKTNLKPHYEKNKEKINAERRKKYHARKKSSSHKNESMSKKFYESLKMEMTFTIIGSHTCFRCFVCDICCFVPKILVVIV